MPPSANAHELFRGFSFVAPSLMEEIMEETAITTKGKTFAASAKLVCSNLEPVAMSELAKRRANRRSKLSQEK